MKKPILIVIAIIAVLGIGLYLSQKGPKPAVNNDFAAVPNDAQLQVNMQKAGLPQLSQEGSVMHIHQHLDISINGKSVAIPADIGAASTFISPVHTHDGTGIIHVESPEKKDFKLSQFFDEWGVTFTDQCIGNYCSDGNNKMLMFVNGKPVQNVRDYVLAERDEIYIWYGPKDQNPTPISSYQFSESY